MMSQYHSEIVYLSLFYWALSVGMLRVAIGNKAIVYWIGSVTFSLIAFAAWSFGMKGLLASSLGFMVMAMSISLTVILNIYRKCSKELEEMQKGESENGQ